MYTIGIEQIQLLFIHLETALCPHKDEDVKLNRYFFCFGDFFLGKWAVLLHRVSNRKSKSNQCVCGKESRYIRSWKFTRTRSRSFSFTFSCVAVNCRQRQCSRLKTGNKRVSVSSSSHCPTSPNVAPGLSSYIVTMQCWRWPSSSWHAVWQPQLLSHVIPCISSRNGGIYIYRKPVAHL